MCRMKFGREGLNGRGIREPWMLYSVVTSRQGAVTLHGVTGLIQCRRILFRHEPHSPVPWSYESRPFRPRGTGLNQPAVLKRPDSLEDGCFEAYLSA